MRHQRLDHPGPARDDPASRLGETGVPDREGCVVARPRLEEGVPLSQRLIELALIVIGVFLFRIRERFDSVDIGTLDRFRGERR